MKLPYRLLLVLGTTAGAVDDRIDDSAWHDAVAIDKFDANWPKQLPAPTAKED